MSYQSEIALMGRRGANAFRKNDAVRALQSARDDGLEPTGMQVSIAANGDVVFRIYTSMDVLRRLAKEADDPNCVVLAERAINDYLKSEIDALKAAIERIGKAIDEDAAKGQGEDWSLMVGYVQSCREKPPGMSEEWQKD